MSDEMCAARINALSSAWCNQMDAMWRVHRFASVLEAGVLATSWFLFDEQHSLYASYVLIFANWLLLTMYFISHRHFQIQNGFQKELMRLEIFSEGMQPEPICGYKFYSHDFAKLTIIFLALVNVLFFFICYDVDRCGVAFSSAVFEILLIAAVLAPMLFMLLEFGKLKKESKNKEGQGNSKRV